MRRAEYEIGQDDIPAYELLNQLWQHPQRIFGHGRAAYAGYIQDVLQEVWLVHQSSEYDRALHQDVVHPCGNIYDRGVLRPPLHEPRDSFRQLSAL